MAGAPAIETRDLRKRFGRHDAVRGIDLVVERGQVFGLIGPNGSGKTTTLKLLLDLLRPSAGRVRVLGLDPRAAGPSLRRRIGYLPGELRLDGRATGRRLLRHYARLSGPVESSRVAELAERFGVDLGRPIRTLSKGNKQKLGLIQAFMHRPELLVLDEPTSGLDPLMQREFHALVREVIRDGATVVLSSHVLSEVQQIAEEVAVLAEGQVVARDTVDALRVHAVRRVFARARTSDPTQLADDLRAEPALAGLRVEVGASEVLLTGATRGDVSPLVRALAALDLADLTLTEPDLEESVLHLYRPDAPTTEHVAGGALGADGDDGADGGDGDDGVRRIPSVGRPEGAAGHD